jgi:hypothetical protein
MSRHPVRYGETISGAQTLRRSLASVVDEIVILVRDMDESPAKRTLKAELSAIGDAVRRLEVKILGPHRAVRSEAVA